jgi:hypothetical protein
MREPGKRRLLRDILAYIGIAIGVLALGTTYVLRSLVNGVQPELPVRWIFLAAATALIFGNALKALWGGRHRRRFWLGFMALLALHIAVTVRVLAGLHSSPALLLLALLCPLEYFVVSFALLAVSRSSRHH